MKSEKARLKELKARIKRHHQVHEKRMSPFHEERDKIQKSIRDKKLSKYIGRYFRYRNSYGSGEWWFLYFKVIGICDNWDFKCLSVQQPLHPEVEIMIRETHIGMLKVEITKKEFYKAFAEALKKIDKAEEVQSIK